MASTMLQRHGKSKNCKGYKLFKKRSLRNSRNKSGVTIKDPGVIPAFNIPSAKENRKTTVLLDKHKPYSNVLFA